MKTLFSIFFMYLSTIGFSCHTPPTDIELEFNKKKLVTYANHSGRFGDQLLCYIHAKWISYYYGIPILYRPFSYSDQLVLHYEENTVAPHGIRYVYPFPNRKVNYNAKRRECYVLPYFPDSEWEKTHGPTSWYSFPVDWKDEGFRQELRRLIRPIKSHPFLILPADRISVAIHVRTGVGFDSVDTWKGYPMKFPSASYYIEQLRTISKIFSGKPLYVHIFTDDANPLKLVDEYKQHLQDLDIQFNCRRKNNHHTSNVLEDFFEMMRFECLIIPDSNFSIIPSKLGDYKVVISPTNFSLKGDEIHIDAVCIETAEGIHF